jgi:hypothetical protein
MKNRLWAEQWLGSPIGKCQVIIILIIIGVLGRWVPHIPNMTPVLSLSLFAGSHLGRRMALTSILIILFISDVGLSLWLDYPVFGYWTLFTYSGFAIIVLVGSNLKNSLQSFPIYIFGSSLYFWFWTNMGVWLTGNLYPKTLTGLITCYTVALPFLHNSLIGDTIWGTAIFGAFGLIMSHSKKTVA